MPSTSQRNPAEGSPSRSPWHTLGKNYGECQKSGLAVDDEVRHVPTEKALKHFGQVIVFVVIVEAACIGSNGVFVRETHVAWRSGDGVYLLISPTLHWERSSSSAFEYERKQ